MSKRNNKSAAKPAKSLPPRPRNIKVRHTHDVHHGPIGLSEEQLKGIENDIERISDILFNKSLREKAIQPIDELLVSDDSDGEDRYVIMHLEDFGLNNGLRVLVVCDDVDLAIDYLSDKEEAEGKKIPVVKLKELMEL